MRTSFPIMGNFPFSARRTSGYSVVMRDVVGHRDGAGTVPSGLSSILFSSSTRYSRTGRSFTFRISSNSHLEFGGVQVYVLLAVRHVPDVILHVLGSRRWSPVTSIRPFFNSYFCF